MSGKHTKRIAVAEVLVLLLVAAAGFSAPPQDAAAPPVTAKPEPAPSWLVYHFLFRQVTAFDQKATEMDQRGQSGDEIRNYFAKKGKLGSEEARTLKGIAAACELQVQVLDGQAEAVIAAARAQWPQKAGAPRPTPPTVLMQMQEQRDKTIKDSVEALKKALGEQVFKTLDDFVRNDFANQVRVARIGETPPPPPPVAKQ